MLNNQEMYCPPLTIRVVDCRSFGRFTLVSHQSFWSANFSDDELWKFNEEL